MDLLFKKKPTPQQKNEDCQAKIILKMKYPAIHPSQLLEPLAMAICFESIHPVAMSLSDINLYKLTSFDNKFIGTCFAVKENNNYYGNITGSTEIISFNDKNFIITQTKEIFAPLKRDKAHFYVLILEYNNKQDNIYGLYLKKITEDNPDNGEIIYSFEKDTEWYKALEVAENIVSKL